MWRMEARAWFGRYVAAFGDGPGRMHPLLELKVVHSQRVADEARGLAEDMGWAARDIETAEVLGLLHDVGRFTQFREFATFADARSVDHGERGFDVLSAGWPFGERVEGETRDCVLAGVRYHNRRVVPESVSGNARRFVHLIRDADKLDIFEVVNAAIREGRLDEFPEILHGVDLAGPPSPVLIDEILTCGVGSYVHARSLADFKLIQLSWAFDLNYPASYRQVARRRVMERIGELLPPTPDIQRLLGKVRERVKAGMAGKVEEATR